MICWYHNIDLHCSQNVTFQKKNSNLSNKAMHKITIDLVTNNLNWILHFFFSIYQMPAQIFHKKNTFYTKGVFDLLTWKYARTQHCHLTICRRVGLSSWWSFGPAYLARLRTFSRPSQCLSEAYLVVYNIDIRYS